MLEVLDQWKELLNFPLFGGMCYVIYRLSEKVEKIGTDVAILMEDRRRKEEEEYCRPVHRHEKDFHGAATT